jgi:hypothetical protein
MTESVVEALLQKMALAEPSEMLDERVADALQNSTRWMERGTSRRKLWGIVSTTAVACLLLGVTVGRATVATERNSSVGFSEPVEPRNPEVVVVKITETGAEAIGFPNFPDGPEVTILCAMAEHDTGGNKKQCVDCHTGLPAAESRFAAEHVKHPYFATCMLCHDRTESTDGIVDDHHRSF